MGRAPYSDKAYLHPVGHTHGAAAFGLAFLFSTVFTPSVLTLFCALVARGVRNLPVLPVAVPARRAPWRQLIPSFGPDGQRDRWYSLAACLHYEAIQKATLKRNRRGVILAMLFREEGGRSSLVSTMHPGQRYSFLGECRVWQHSEIDTCAADFQRAALDSCLFDPFIEKG